MRILILDDSAIERAILARIAVSRGHEIVGEASDLDAALPLLGSAAPDLVVLDGRLPPQGGLAALDAVRAAAPGVWVAVVAALEEVEFVRAACERGAAGALRRPFLVSQVTAALAELAAG